MDIKAGLERERQENREACKKSLYYLSKYILGYEEVDEDFHLPLCKQIEEINPYIVKNEGTGVERSRLWLIARGHFKTTIITISHTIQAILLNPDIRILVCHNKLDNAKGVLSQVKWHFTNNEFFRLLFPEYCPPANKDGKVEFGTTENFTVPNRTKVYGEPTVDTAGVDTTKTGRHYDYIKKDDIVYEKSVTNEDQLEATRQWDARSQFLFDNAEKGLQDYVGTRYHFADIYETLLKSGIKASVIPAWNDAGEVAFKARFSKEGLEKLLKSGTMSPYDFYTQFLLKPISPDDMVFKPEWLKYRDELFDKNWTYYIFVDPAGEKKKRSDYTVMVVVGVDKNGKRHVVDGVRDKLHLHERIETLKKFIEKWKPFKVSYERIGMQADLQEIDRRKRNETFPYIPIEEAKLSPKETKNDRIRGLQGLFFNGMITLPKELKFYSTYHQETQDFVELFKYEYFQFPMSEHDDILDTLSQMTKLSVLKGKGEKKEEVKPQGETFMDVVNRARRAKYIQTQNPYDEMSFEEAYKYAER